jgi:hypothetical protein
VSGAAGKNGTATGTGSSSGRPVTLRAMLAAECSPELSTGVKHLVHVLALRADNTSGQGLTGQATLGVYMGITGRQVRRLWAELDEAWSAGTSPVGALREKRWQTSDRYTVVVRPDAPLRLASRPDKYDTSDRTPVSGHTPGKRTFATSGADTSVRLTPSGADISVLLTSQLTLQSEAVKEKKELPRPAASGAPPHALGEMGKAPTTEAQARSARRVAAARGYAKP